MSAILVAAKFALSFIPNVEVITLLTIAFAYAFGLRSVVATFVFCTLDMLIYPISIDVIIAYYIYWNTLSFTVSLLRQKIFSTAFYTALAVLFTLMFSILTTATYSIFFGVNFFSWYAAGLVYFAIHIASALVTLLIGFSPLTKVLIKLKTRLEPSL